MIGCGSSGPPEFFSGGSMKQKKFWRKIAKECPSRIDANCMIRKGMCCKEFCPKTAEGRRNRKVLNC